MTALDLAYTALAVRDVDAASTVLGTLLGLPRLTVSCGDETIIAHGVGRSALILFPVGHPFLASGNSGVDHIALEADDPVRAAAGFATGSAASTGLNGAEQVSLARNETAGVATRFTTRLDLSGAPTAQVERIDHIGIAAADILRSEAVFHQQIGLPVESRQTDMEVHIPVESFTSDRYGVVYRTRDPEPAGGLRVLFLTTGDCELEFLQNFDPRHTAEIDHGTAGNTKQDQGAIARYVARHGEGLHHIALKTPDIDAVLHHLSEAGCRMIDRQGRPGSRRSLIGFVHPASLGGVLLHFVMRVDRAHSSGT